MNSRGITYLVLHKGVMNGQLTRYLTRLALSHNQISTFPSRFSECTSLRYLNVRNNVIREFPQSVCELRSHEIGECRSLILNTDMPVNFPRDFRSWAK